LSQESLSLDFEKKIVSQESLSLDLNLKKRESGKFEFKKIGLTQGLSHELT
jgi:hypothetical protein